MKKRIAFIVVATMIITVSGCGREERKNFDVEDETSLSQKEEDSDMNQDYENRGRDNFYITKDNTIGELMEHPLLGTFANEILPWDDRSYDQSIKMSEIASLLPYHSHIDTDTIVAPLNNMIDEMEEGKQVFYDIYTEEEKQDDPSKENAGIFFFRGATDAPFAIVNAGGGFSYVGSLHESFPHALEISEHGYNAFALRYRTGGADVAVEDLARAITYIFEHAEELGISTESYSLWGGSAGARMAAYLGSYGPSEFGGDDLPRPGIVVMQYTGHSEYTRNDPPTYVCVGEDDRIASWKTMQNRLRNLDKLGIDTEFHKYPNLEHGFGLGIGTSAEGWIEDAIAFWEVHMK